MAQSFKETAHLKTDQKAYEEGWERIFGKKKEDTKEEKPKDDKEETDDK